MRKAKKQALTEMSRALFGAEITRLMAEYGPVRLARLEVPEVDTGETLVVISPIFCVPGGVQLPAATILESRLFRLGEAAYGSIANAAREFGSKKSSLQNKDC